MSDTEARPASAPRPPPVRYARASIAATVRDLRLGALNWTVWSLLGWHDIRQRYRRSRIGPFWLTISMGVMVGSLGFVYATLFGIDLSDYLPFLAAGVILWNLLSALVLEGCSVFIDMRAIIKQTRMPLSTHVFRMICRVFIIFFHNIAIYFVVALVVGAPLSWTILLALPALALVGLNAVWIALLLGLICARFRDVPQIMASIMQLGFFVTPIIWRPDQRPGLEWVLALNPFYHAIEIVRAPLLGEVGPLTSWLTMLGFLVGGGVVAFLVFRAFRWRVAYWV